MTRTNESEGSDGLLLGESLRLERSGPVVTLTLDRPASRNAIPPDAWPMLTRAVTTLATDASVGALVLTGAGSVFSSGADLKAPAPSGVGALGPSSRIATAHEALLALMNAPFPVVAAVEGYAVGIAWSLVLACDLVVAADDSYFSAPFVARGIVPDGAIGWFLARSAGHGAAFDIFTTADRVAATDAQALGLVQRLVPKGEALAVASSIAEKLAAGPRDAISLTKRLLHSAQGAGLEAYLAAERYTISLNAASPDLQEGRAAFREGRSPQWGRHRSQAAGDDAAHTEPQGAKAE